MRSDIIARQEWVCPECGHSLEILRGNTDGDVIWHKPDPLPESAVDRPTKAHEYLFLLSKRAKYFYDAEAIAEPQSERERTRRLRERERGLESVYELAREGNTGQTDPGTGSCLTSVEARQRLAEKGTRNRRSVWTIATEPTKVAHFAAFPRKLVEPCIRAGTSQRGYCPTCGGPWVRVSARRFERQGDVSEQRGLRGHGGQKPMAASSGWQGYPRGRTTRQTTGWRPSCGCYDERYVESFPQARRERKRGQQMVSGRWWLRVRRRAAPESWPTERGVVMDPFMGTGTVAVEAVTLARGYVGIEQAQRYVAMSRDRLREELPLFAGREG